MSAQPKDNAPSSEQMNFSADVSRLLDIVANALYSNHDVFLRELISNAADACDRLRYDAIQSPALTQDNPNFRIHIYKDTDTRTLTITDNGIGMNRDELIDHLGTIAKSGTGKLMEQMKAVKEASAESGENGDALKLIGQFGVGFYASYMVSDYVRVTSRRAGSDEINTWHSDGRTGFSVDAASDAEKALLDGDRGTAIVLQLKEEEGANFLVDEKLKQTIGQYSDHIDVKIFLNTPKETQDGEGQPANEASAIWKRPKSEVTKEQYTEFYRHITHGFDEPVLTSHWQAEGTIEYSALLYVPMMRPWDLYDPSRKASVKLYVRRVFISDNLPDLMHPWMRFVRGVIDSEDLPLNISRENLQHNPILSKIRTSVTTRILKDLAKLAKNDEPAFLTFWGQFGAAMKEGLYDAYAHREDIFKLCRFFSSNQDGDQLTSLEDYISRMPEHQKDIYYISGENAETLRNSPQIEGFKARGLEVLFMTDTVDEFWLQQVSDYQGKNFKSVTQGDIDLDSAEKGEDKDSEKTAKEDAQTQEALQPLLSALQEALSDHVGEVRPSKRLTDSPVCLIAPTDAPDMHMERVLKIQQNYTAMHKPILEINPKHALIEKLQKSDEDTIKDSAQLLLDQALIIQGEPLRNPADFVKRMSTLMADML